MSADRGYTGDADIDRLLFRWGAVIRDAEGWARNFALSIQRARKRTNWTPSPKQLALMRRMVAELPMSPEGEDGEMIEKD